LFSAALFCEAPPLLAQKAPDPPVARFQQGLAERALGLQMLGLAKPAEVTQIRSKANQHFDSAASHFSAASMAFRARLKKLPGVGEALPSDLEWAACAPCGRAEMELRLL